MSRWKALQEKRKQFTRFQVLKSIFSSVIMTVVVVTAAVIFIPQSPEANILYLEPFNDRVLYQISVVDPDNAIIEDSLKVILENQLDYHESSLEPGDNNGYFEGLMAGSDYQIKVVADKGFGLEVLASENLETEVKTGGRITAVDVISHEDEMNEILVGYLISDPENQYQRIDIHYGLIYPSEETAFFYQTLSLDKTSQQVTLQGLHGGNARLHLIMEGFLGSGASVVLDERIVQLPYQLYASLYLTEVSDRLASVSIYADMCCEMEISYWLQLEVGDRVIQEAALDVSADPMTHEALTFSFTKLRPGHDYSITLMASYRDPYTLQSVQRAVSNVEFRTLERFESEVSVEDIGSAYQVTITAVDGFDQCDGVFYAVYEVSEFGTWQIQYVTLPWDLVSDTKTVTFLIEKPAYEQYRVDVGIYHSDESYYQVRLTNIFSYVEVDS